jgi:hypothetical protein
VNDVSGHVELFFSYSSGCIHTYSASGHAIPNQLVEHEYLSSSLSLSPKSSHHVTRSSRNVPWEITSNGTKVECKIRGYSIDVSWAIIIHQHPASPSTLHLIAPTSNFQSWLFVVTVLSLQQPPSVRYAIPSNPADDVDRAEPLSPISGRANHRHCSRLLRIQPTSQTVL